MIVRMDLGASAAVLSKKLGGRGSVILRPRPPSALRERRASAWSPAAPQEWSPHRKSLVSPGLGLRGFLIGSLAPVGVGLVGAERAGSGRRRGRGLTVERVVQGAGDLPVGARIGSRRGGPVRAAGRRVASRVAITHDDARCSVAGRCAMAGARRVSSPSKGRRVPFVALGERVAAGLTKAWYRS